MRQFFLLLLPSKMQKHYVHKHLDNQQRPKKSLGFDLALFSPSSSSQKTIFQRKICCQQKVSKISTL